MSIYQLKQFFIIILFTLFLIFVNNFIWAVMSDRR